MEVYIHAADTVIHELGVTEELDHDNKTDSRLTVAGAGIASHRGQTARLADFGPRERQV